MCTRASQIPLTLTKQLDRLRTTTRARVPQQRVAQHRLGSASALLHVERALQREEWQQEQRHLQPQLSCFAIPVPSCCSGKRRSTSTNIRGSTITGRSEDSTHSSRCSSTSAGAFENASSGRGCTSAVNDSHRRRHSSSSSRFTFDSRSCRRSSSRTSACINNLQQRVATTCGNCSGLERNSTTSMPYYVAGTCRTRTSVAVLKQVTPTLKHASGGAAHHSAGMQRTLNSRNTAVLPTNHPAGKASAIAGRRTRHLYSEATPIQRGAGLRKAGVATTTALNAANCATGGAMAAGECGAFDKTAGGAAGECRSLPENATNTTRAAGQRVSAAVPTAGREAAALSLQAPTATGTKEQRSETEQAAARARTAERLWNTFVPERNWGVKSPMFWILLVMVLVLHAYNNKRDKEKAETHTDEDTKEQELRDQVERHRQERRVLQGQGNSEGSKSETP